MKLVKTKHQLTTPYNPAANGMVEKYNGTLCKSLKKLAAHKPGEWDTYIPTVLYSYRVRAYEVLGISPYELVYGLAWFRAQDSQKRDLYMLKTYIDDEIIMDEVEQHRSVSISTLNRFLLNNGFSFKKLRSKSIWMDTRERTSCSIARLLLLK